jgi:hypothetical protein
MTEEKMTEPGDNGVFVSYVGDLIASIPDDVVGVESNRDYVRACVELARPPGAGRALRIWARSRTHYAWLRDYADQIGSPARFAEETARTVLADRWNVEIPDWLTDEDVVGAGLLAWEVGGSTRAGFVDRFLVHVLGDPFGAATLDAANLAVVIAALVSERARAALRDSPLVSRCLQAKCRAWASAGGEGWAAELSGHLPERPRDVWHWLSAWAALHGYPEKVLDFVLPPPQAPLVRQIPPDALDGLPLEPTAVEQATTQIARFFREISGQVETSEGFLEVVGCTSGRLEAEFQAVTDLLGAGGFSPAAADVRAVQEKFRACPGVTSGRMRSLIHRVRPERPVLPGPDETWSAREWIRWTVEEYAPYRRWQVHNGVHEADLEEVVARFSDWYIGEYEAIHRDAGSSLVHSLAELASEDRGDELSIVLLVDCLPLTFAGLLDDALRQAGLSRRSLEHRFAALPTATEFNKPQLLAGVWEEPGGGYPAILRARAESDWGGRRAVYLPDLRALAEIDVPSEPAVLLLNLTDADERLHRDVERENTTHEEELGRLFARLAETVVRLSEAWSGSKEDFGVYVVTDHGACRVLEEERESFDSEVTSRLFPDERHRFAVVDRGHADDIPGNLWAFGHRFLRPFVADDRVYFIPRGHNTVRRPGKGGGYMHGGATPEEVIVPVLSYRLEKVAWKKPAVRIREPAIDRSSGRAVFYIQRVTTLEIEIQNPNTAEIRIVRASVSSPQTDLKGCETPVVPPLGAGVLRMHCYFKRPALEAEALEIEIVYEVDGDAHLLPLRLECGFKSAVTSGFSLKDL